MKAMSMDKMITPASPAMTAVILNTG